MDQLTGSGNTHLDNEFHHQMEAVCLMKWAFKKMYTSYYGHNSKGKASGKAFRRNVTEIAESQISDNYVFTYIAGA